MSAAYWRQGCMHPIPCRQIHALGTGSVHQFNHPEQVYSQYAEHFQSRLSLVKVLSGHLLRL